jgi:hydroxymethylpyrimidine/phosphomethylpyrimidine kinase
MPMSAITALTAQNTTGVYGVLGGLQDAFWPISWIVFFGYLSRCGENRHGILLWRFEVIAEKLRGYGAKNIVVDPVL